MPKHESRALLLKGRCPGQSEAILEQPDLNSRDRGCAKRDTDFPLWRSRPCGLELKTDINLFAQSNGDCGVWCSAARTTFLFPGLDLSVGNVTADSP
jgi:hypothetical protein